MRALPKLTKREQALLDAAQAQPGATAYQLARAARIVDTPYVYILRRRLKSFGLWPQSPPQDARP